MIETPSPSFTAFLGPNRLASGPLAEVAIAVMKASRIAAAPPIIIFDDASGRPIDLDLRGTEREIVARLPQPAPDAGSAGGSSRGTEPRGRGRPKLGVVAREVTLLPRHWDWLATQPGGASVALRKLVEEARRSQRRSRPQPRRQGRGLSFHVDHGRQSAGLRGSLARIVRGRPAAICRTDCRLA